MMMGYILKAENWLQKQYHSSAKSNKFLHGKIIHNIHMCAYISDRMLYLRFSHKQIYIQ